ncbi:MAG: hypothetical protein MUE54_04420 [Anaerolineae bacterium]|nr:hypothetical protein [Anaerolineae bacterium]
MGTNLKAIGLGFFIWFIVLIIMRVLGSSVFSEGNPWLIVFYIGTFPAGILFTYVMRIILNIPMRDMLQPMVILAIIAIMMDGFSFAFTDFYGVGEHEIYSAAYLLWAPGVFLLCALLIINRAKETSPKNMLK